jgi:hypothetical protein
MDHVREGTMETCYFCGANYVERWPREFLAVMTCPQCGATPPADLIARYPDKFKKPEFECSICDCGGNCGEDCKCGS